MADRGGDHTGQGDEQAGRRAMLVVASMAQPVIVIGADGCVEIANAAARSVLDLGSDITRARIDDVGLDFAATEMSPILRCVQDGEPFDDHIATIIAPPASITTFVQPGLLAPLFSCHANWPANLEAERASRSLSPSRSTA